MIDEILKEKFPIDTPIITCTYTERAAKAMFDPHARFRVQEIGKNLILVMLPDEYADFRAYVEVKRGVKKLMKQYKREAQRQRKEKEKLVKIEFSMPALQELIEGIHILSPFRPYDLCYCDTDSVSVKKYDDMTDSMIFGMAIHETPYIGANTAFLVSQDSLGHVVDTVKIMGFDIEASANCPVCDKPMIDGEEATTHDASGTKMHTECYIAKRKAEKLAYQCHGTIEHIEMSPSREQCKISIQEPDAHTVYYDSIHDGWTDRQ